MLVGRILNRFSSDQYAVDDSLPFISNIFLAQTIGLIGTIVRKITHKANTKINK
jgi:ATP-binding cassette subfamily C (CFTR/MRP) protein 10